MEDQLPSKSTLEVALKPNIANAHIAEPNGQETPTSALSVGWGWLGEKYPKTRTLERMRDEKLQHWRFCRRLSHGQ
jgi:hypothetical protein